MKKSSFIFTAALCSILTVMSFSCKDKDKADQNSVEIAAGTSTEDADNNFQEQKIAPDKKNLIEPIKMEVLDPDLLYFYTQGRLYDTMYVTATSGLKVRKEPSTDSETVAKLPHRFPAKIVAVGKKITVADMNSYWVKVVLPNYESQKSEPSFGWVFGGYLSPSVPDFEVPETKEELAAYISARPIILYNDWIPTSRFAGPTHDFFLYPDGNFDAYLFQNDDDVEKIANGTWEADSPTHITLKSDALDFDGFYCYRISDDGFECPDTDNPDDKLIARARRTIDTGFGTEKLFNYYKYAYEMNNAMNFGKEYSLAKKFSDSFSVEQIQTMIASGVDMTGTGHEADYKSYWDPVREKHKVQAVTIKTGGTFTRTLPFNNTGAGSLITPVDGKTFNIYSIPKKNEDKICGTITSGEIAIIKNVVVSSFPIPINDVYYKIINTANGTEGWIYIYTDYYTDEEIDYLCTYSDNENTDGFKYVDRINANVIFREDQFATPDTGKNVAVSPDGKYLAYTSGSEICISDVNAGEWKSSLNVNQNLNDAVIAYSHDGDHIFIVTDRGNFLDYQISFKDINKEIPEAFSFKNANFMYPSRIYVSPDDRFIYVIADRDTYSRRITKMLIFDTKKEKLYEYDFRSKQDQQDGFYHYSPVYFNSKGEAVYSMLYGDGLTVLLSLDSDDDLKAETFDIEEPYFPMFEASGEDLVLNNEAPDYFIKASRKGVILDKTKKYALPEDQETDRFDSKIILHSDKKMAAKITRVYDEDYNCKATYASVYSLKTLNHLFTFQCPDYEEPYYEWTGDYFFVLDTQGNKSTVFTMRISEKDKQADLFPKLTAQEEKLYTMNHTIVQDSYTLYLNLFPTGIYKITSLEDWGMEAMNRGSIYGPYEWSSAKEIVLHNATIIPIKYSGHNLDETSEEFKKFMMNIPLLTKDGTLEIDVNMPENGSAPSISCWYYAK